MIENKRGLRPKTMVTDPVDKCYINTVEIGEILKSYVSVEDNLKINDNSLYMIYPHKENDRYVRAIEINEYDKIYCPDEDELYKIDKKLNKFGFKTRIGRNCDTGTLSIVILEEPEIVKEE